MEETIGGRVPRAIDLAAKREGLEPGRLARLVAAGRVVIPRNVRREIEPMGVGELLKTKVNVNSEPRRPWTVRRQRLRRPWRQWRRVRTL